MRFSKPRCAQILRDAKRVSTIFGVGLFYDRRRHEEAIELWEKSANLDRNFSIVWRNLGIGYFNIRRQPAKARAAYDKAFKANLSDARLLYERDQLWKRLGEKPAKKVCMDYPAISNWCNSATI